MELILRYILILVATYSVMSTIIMLLGQALICAKSNHAFVMTNIIVSFPLAIDIFIYTQTINVFKVVLPLLILQIILTLCLKHKYRHKK